MEGWISLHRKIKKHWIWEDPEYLKVWIDLLLRANHEKKKILFNKELIEVERGQFITSLKKLALENKCSIGKIRRILDLLESDTMIERKTTRKATHITICNYDSYQDLRHTKSTQKAYRKHTDSTLNETNNNENNVNNIYEREGNELSFDVASEITDEAQKLMLTTFGRNPKIPEIDIINKHLKKFGFEKTKRIYNTAVLKNFNSLKTLDEKLNDDGTIKPKDSSNGKFTNSAKQGATDEELVKIATRRYLRQQQQQ